jgi:hypothetical protein
MSVTSAFARLQASIVALANCPIHGPGLAFCWKSCNAAK